MSEDNKEDELDILVDDASDKGNEIEIPVEPSADAAPSDWKAQLEAAQNAAKEADARREEAERLRSSEAERYAREVAESQRSTVSAEMAAIDNAIANVEHERADAKMKYKLAMEAGDFEAAADAQDAISAVAVKAQRIKEGKAALERRAEDTKTANDPVERIASQATPKSAAWIRSHGDMFRDPIKAKKVEQAHFLAIGNGHDVETDGYFKFVEDHLFGQQETKPEARNDPPVVRQQSAPAAPVSRGGAAEAPQTRGTTIRLTSAQREIAALSGLTDAEYAKHLLAIQRENGTTTH
jgi:hypothetical protein